jgi:hypothetical protein
MFDPPDVVTVWIALDTMDAELGPLEYVRGSHLWKSSANDDSGVGRATKQFFDSQRGGRDLLYGAAAASMAAEGDEAAETRPNLDSMLLDFVSMAGLPAGGLSIHHGMTWHGSGPNRSHLGNPSRSRPRRGLGIHYMPANARFTDRAKHSKLWKKYVTSEGTVLEDASKMKLPDCDFPIVWEPPLGNHHYGKIGMATSNERRGSTSQDHPTSRTYWNNAHDRPQCWTISSNLSREDAFTADGIVGCIIATVLAGIEPSRAPV